MDYEESKIKLVKDLGFSEEKLDKLKIYVNELLNFNKKYNLIFGVTNITNHTNSKFGPYLGRSGYIEIKTNLKRK